MNKILTSLSALYKQNIISFSPNRIYLEMLNGTNPTNYNSKKYKISLQNSDTFKLGTICKNNLWMYSPERLFIELNKFPLENTIKREALHNLKRMSNPELVYKYYQILKFKRRNLDRKAIENYLDQNLLRIKEMLENNDDKKMIIMEYIMALVSQREVPVNLYKSNLTIEFYAPYKRATLDSNLLADKRHLKAIIAHLKKQGS